MAIKTVSILIPVFNEEKFLSQSIARVFVAYCYGMKKDIIIIDDCSDVGTKELIRKIKTPKSKQSHNLKKIFKKANEGKGAAIKEGLKYAKGDIIIIQDADLEYNPIDYKNLLKPFLSNKKVAVYGSRTLGIKKYKNKYSNLFFYIGGRVLTYCINILYGTSLTDQPTGYKLFKKDMIPVLLKNRQNDFSYEIEMTASLVKNRVPVVEVPIRYVPRNHKEGKKIKPKDFIKSIYIGVKGKIN